jgi:hypothetical protein
VRVLERGGLGGLIVRGKGEGDGDAVRGGAENGDVRLLCL